MSETDFATVCDILAQVWIEYKEEAEFADFIEYNDIGLPLAYCISEGIVSTAPLAEQYIMETWALLLSALDLEDTGQWSSLEDLLEDSGTGMGGA
jgi:hypothetical protein